MIRLTKNKIKYACIILAIISLLIHFFGSSKFIEQFYSTSIFYVVRIIFDNTITRLPFPLLYLMIMFITIWIFYYLFKTKTKYKLDFLSILSYSSFFMMLSYLLWGFNYGRIPFEQKADLPISDIDSKYLVNEYLAITDTINAIRREHTASLDLLSSNNSLPDTTIILIGKELKNVLGELGYGTYGDVKIKYLAPRGGLMSIGIAGIYIPLLGEGYIDSGMHSLQQAFILTHEMSHGYGIVDEGGCDFLAYLALTKSTNPSLRYIGYLNYWRILSYDMAFDEKGKKIRAHVKEDILIPQVKSDLEGIRNAFEIYPDKLGGISSFINDLYLKTVQPGSGGEDSYGKIVALVKAWNSKNI